MKQARVSIAIAGWRIDRPYIYEERDEQKTLMSGIRCEIKPYLSRFERWALKALSDRKLMQRIVRYENKHFNRKPAEPAPEGWPDFRAWAIRRNYLRITEADDDTGTCAEPPEEVARKP